MRLPKSLRFWMIIAGVLLLLLIILLPLRFAVDISGDEQKLFSAKQVSGTIWSGRIVDSRIAGLPVGNLDSHLELWPLFRGRMQFLFERGASAAQPAFRASVGSGSGYFSVGDASGTLPVSEIFLNMPVKSMELLELNAEFVSQKCATASGQVRVIPDAIIPGLDLQAGLLGKARCERGDLLLELASQSGMEKLELRIKGNGQYSADLMLIGDQSAIAPVLAGSGFRAVSGGYRLSRSGKF